MAPTFWGRHCRTGPSSRIRSPQRRGAGSATRPGGSLDLPFRFDVRDFEGTIDDMKPPVQQGCYHHGDPPYPAVSVEDITAQTGDDRASGKPAIAPPSTACGRGIARMKWSRRFTRPGCCRDWQIAIYEQRATESTTPSCRACSCCAEHNEAGNPHETDPRRCRFSNPVSTLGLLTGAKHTLSHQARRRRTRRERSANRAPRDHRHRRSLEHTSAFTRTSPDTTTLRTPSTSDR